MTQASTVELGDDEGLNRFRCQAREHDRISDTGTDFLVDGQGERLQERRLADEEEVVGTGEVLAEQAQFAQAIGGHEVSVVNDGDEHSAGAVDFEGFLNQEAFAPMVVSFKVDLESLAEDAQGIVVSVKSPVADGCIIRFGS